MITGWRPYLRSLRCGGEIR